MLLKHVNILKCRNFKTYNMIYPYNKIIILLYLFKCILYYYGKRYKFNITNNILNI